ncbi:hypothetical protein Tco_0647522 [Tanacetum coccineum]
MQGAFEKCLNHFPATYLTTPRNRKPPQNTPFQEDLTRQPFREPTYLNLGQDFEPTTGREHSQEINNLSIPALTSQAPGPSQKRSRSPSSPFFPDATTFFDGKPAYEASELNPEDVTARLEDLEVEIDTLHADTEDKELLIPELHDSIAAAAK